MLRGCHPGILSWLIVVLPLAAQSPDPYESKVQSLSHPRYAEREKAARELIAAGEPALKALRAVSTSSDPELRDRAAAVAEKIDRVLRSERLLVAPKLAIKLDQVPLQQALTQVAQKSGLRFHFDPGKESNTQRPISLDTGEVPFWEAIQVFYSAAGLVENDMPAAGPSAETKMSRIYYGHGSRRSTSGMIRLTDANSAAKSLASMPQFASKAIRVRALPPEFPQNKFDESSAELTLHLDLDPAPALKVQELIGVEVRRAVTDEKHLLAVCYSHAANSMGVEYLSGMVAAQQVVVLNGEVLINEGTGGSGSYPVTLKTGTIRPRKLSELEGVVIARVVTPPQPLLTIANVFSKGKDQSFHGEDRSIQILSADRGNEKSPATLKIRVRASVDSMNDVLSIPVQLKGRLQPFVRIERRGGSTAQNSPDFQLRTSDGKLINATKQVNGASFDGVTASCEVSLRFERPVGGLEDLTLTVTGQRSVLVEMPFVLKDVPLP